MPQNDSDSSDDDNAAYSTTNVLLGYASREPTDDLFSQLGGLPTWLDPQCSPDAQFARCSLCQNTMTLLLQLNGDLPDRFPSHERRLYIFACKKKPCRRRDGSIRAVRAVRLVKPVAGKKREKRNSATPGQESIPKPPRQNLGNTLFNAKPTSISNENTNPFSTSATQNPNPFSSNPFSNPPATSHTSNPIQTPSPETLPATFAQKARISSPPPIPSTPPEPWLPESAFPQPYPSYHLDADFETLDAPSSTPPHIKPSEPNDEPSHSSNDDPHDDPDAFESSLDKTFHRFADRLAQNPLQVLRYEFGGSPLLYSKTDAVGTLWTPSALPNGVLGNKKITTIRAPAASPRAPGIPRCGNCGAERVFELQLTPQAIAELEVEEDGIEGMEWGSVVLGVCAVDCEGKGVRAGRVGWVEEWVGVQWEEQVGGAGMARAR